MGLPKLLDTPVWAQDQVVVPVAIPAASCKLLGEYLSFRILGLKSHYVKVEFGSPIANYTEPVPSIDREETV